MATTNKTAIVNVNSPPRRTRRTGGRSLFTRRDWISVSFASSAVTRLFELLTDLLSRRHALLIVRLLEIEQADPRKAHLIDRALSVADPVPRVRVVLVRRRVVVPRRNVNDGAGRQQRRDLLDVRIGNVPAELIVADTVQRLSSCRTRSC